MTCILLDAIAGLPLVWRHPQNQFVNNNDKVTFECFANGSDSLTITWEKDRRSFTSGVTQVTTHSIGVSSGLTLYRARVADSGKYRCRATNVDGNSSTSTEAELISKLHMFKLSSKVSKFVYLQFSHSSSPTLIMLPYSLASQQSSLVMH